VQLVGRSGAAIWLRQTPDRLRRAPRVQLAKIIVERWRNIEIVLLPTPSRVNTCDGLHHIMDADAQVLLGSALPQQNSAETTHGR
jgi:hypothetical protein